MQFACKLRALGIHPSVRWLEFALERLLGNGAGILGTLKQVALHVPDGPA